MHPPKVWSQWATGIRYPRVLIFYLFLSFQVSENTPSETNPHPGQSPVSLSSSSPHPQQSMSSSSQLHQPTALSVQSMEQLQLSQSTHSNEASNNQLSLQGFPQS